MTKRPLPSWEAALSRRRSELEEWNRFLIRHTQRLESCDNLLFSLCHFEGPPSIRRRCEERLTACKPMPPWIRATPQWVPPAAEDPSEQIEVCTSHTFPAVAACALAPRPGMAFLFERLGCIGRWDLRQGRKLEPSLAIPRERVLQMACSADGRHVAVAFESGRMDLFQSEPQREGVPTERLVWSARCRLPEYESPSLAFLDGELWREDESGDAVACDASSGVERRRVPPPSGTRGCELTALARVESALVLAWRSGGGSCFISVVDVSGLRQDAEVAGAEVKSMTAWGDADVAVAFSDGRLRLYSVRPALGLRRELGLDSPAACLASGDSGLWGILENGRLFCWTPPAECAEYIGTPGLTLAWARALVPLSGDVGFILTAAAAVSYRRGASARRGAVIQSAVPRREGYVALATAGGEYLVIDAAGHKASALARGKQCGRLGMRADGREVGHIFAVDGDGRALAGHDDVCELFEPSTGARVPCDLPAGVISAAGSAGGGFWLADFQGRIYFLDRHGVWREEAEVPPEIVGPPRVLSWASLLVWTGMSTATKAVLAPDVVHRQSFFRAVAGRLKLLGSREYVTSDGVLRALSWDEVRGRLVGIWQGRERGTAVAKVGTVDELISRRERELPVPLAGDCDSAVMDAGSRRLFVLTTDGAVHCLDADTLRPLATIAGSAPFTCLSEAVSPARQVLAVAGRERVLLLDFERGG